METIKKYRIYDVRDNEYVDAIIGAGTNATQSWFGSVSEARGFNCHGLFKDKIHYKIHEFELRLCNDDADPASEVEINKYKEVQEKSVGDLLNDECAELQQAVQKLEPNFQNWIQEHVINQIKQ